MSAIETIDNTESDALAAFDGIIDVRSPGEFAEDHIPGAINLPVLSNAERAEVGTIYKQQSTFGARRIGASYVSRNIARHLEIYFADQAPSSRFLVYCWRGGMRSRSMATVMNEVGWRTTLLNGGYKTWRRSVVRTLRDYESSINVILIDGQTGAAKSDILRRCAALGVQTLDLEGLAAHRGSVFGGFSETPQPDQKYFESCIAAALAKLDSKRPVLIEAESNRIGRCEIPKRLWQSMLNAPVISVQAEPDLRAEYLLSAYQDIVQNVAAIMDAIDRLAPFHSKETIAAWREMAQSESLAPLAASLMRDHYDPLYSRSRKRRERAPLASITLTGTDDEALNGAAAEIQSLLAAPIAATAS